MDSHNEKRGSFRVPAEATAKVNGMHPITRGTYIYDLYISDRNT